MKKSCSLALLSLMLIVGACSKDPPAETVAPPAAAVADAGRSAVASVIAAAETEPGLPDTAVKGDADDPAFWLHPTDPGQSLVITTAKGAGLRVYDLSGKLVQRIEAELDGRYNNVDVAYGLALPDGSSIDIVVASDRGRDRLMVWRIDPAAVTPLTDITDPAQPQVFPTRRAADGSGEIDNPVADQHSAYGLTLWHDKVEGAIHAIVAQRKEARLVQQRLRVGADGRVGHERVRHWDFPYSHRGQDLTAEHDDPALDWQAQFEGLVVDEERALLFAGQEDVGLWRVDLRSGRADDAPFYETRGSSKSPFNNSGSRIVRDVEGLALYRGADGTGYLIASSQGDAHGDVKAPDAEGLDDTFALFERGGDNRYLGSFRIVAGNGIDGVQECDGAELVSFVLPGFPKGLLMVQDGYNDDLNDMSGKPAATNFKFVSWEAVTAAFPVPLTVAPGAYDPRGR